MVNHLSWWLLVRCHHNDHHLPFIAITLPIINVINQHVASKMLNVVLWNRMTSFVLRIVGIFVLDWLSPWNQITLSFPWCAIYCILISSWYPSQKRSSMHVVPPLISKFMYGHTLAGPPQPETGAVASHSLTVCGWVVYLALTKMHGYAHTILGGYLVHAKVLLFSTPKYS